MTIYIGADHRGFELKNDLRDWLKGEKHEVVDVGAENMDEADDYPNYGFKVGEEVGKDPAQRRGIAICGSGAGMAVAAGKAAGVRAGLIHDPILMAAARRDDDINVLALGADYISGEEAKEVVKAFLTTGFDPVERHVRRINKINQYGL